MNYCLTNLGSSSNAASYWWVYVIVIAAIILLYLGTCLIIRLLTLNAYKRVINAQEKILPMERERFDIILSLEKSMLDDGRHLPKNMVESTQETLDLFESIPVDLSQVKGRDDFLIIYYRKYLKEKNLLRNPKYADYDKQLENITYLDEENKANPYNSYNKFAIKYNSYLNMGLFNIFKGKSEKVPTL